MSRSCVFAALLSRPPARGFGRQRHPPDPGQRADLRAAGPGDERGGEQGRGEGSRPRGHGVGCDDQCQHSQGVEDGCDQQHRALAPPVGQRTEHRGAEGGADSDRTGRGAAHGVRARDRRDQGQGTDGEHGQRQPGEESQRDEAASGQLRKPGEAAAFAEPAGERQVGSALVRRGGRVLQGSGCLGRR